VQVESTKIDSQSDDEYQDQGVDAEAAKEAKKEDKKKGSGMKKYPPSPEELREWMDRKGLSNKDVAKALRLSDGRVVRFWTSKKDPRPIPYPSWYTLRHKFGK